MGKKTHDTKTTLSNDLDPESLYNPGHVPGSDDRETYVPIVDVFDISETAHETLKDYVSQVTSGEASHQGFRQLNKGNTFQVPADNEGSNTGQSPLSSPYRSGQDSETTARELKDDGVTLGTFLNVAQGFNEDQARYFEDLSNSSYGKWGSDAENPFVDGGDGGPLLDKEKGKGGNVLLSSIKENPSTKRSVGDPEVFSESADTDVQKRISSVMLVNRWNASNSTPFMSDHKKNQFGYSQQSKMGTYDPNAKLISESDLKKIGEDLISRAVGHNIDPDASGFGGIGGKYDQAILPSVEQLTGWDTISMGDLRAMNTKGGKGIVADDAGVRSSMLTGDGNVDSKKTYGQLNSEYEHFDGPLPLGMVVNTLISLAALLVTSALIMGIAEGFGALGEDKGDGKVPRGTPPNDLAYGRHALHKDTTGDLFAKLFNVHVPEHNFGTSMFSGVLMFYGIEKIPGPEVSVDFASVMETVGGICMAPGYYSVITRNVTRDTQQIEKAVSDMGSGLGLGGMITQVFKIIEAITTSATWRFLMTMVKIGEKGLHGLHNHPTLGEQINTLGEGAVTRHKKSREYTPANPMAIGSKETGRLAWRHSSSPARYLMPSSFMKAVVRMRDSGIEGAEELDGMLNASPLSRMYMPGAGNWAVPPQDRWGASDLGDGSAYEGDPAVTSGRLPKDYVKWVEDKLESEYMPFYFHDLRTNEIISFHAFMTELTDGFSADYTSTAAYGRGDDIMIYNKTTRSVSFGFWLAATSKADMDMMYWDINKLVSMIYPQWSRGRTMISGEGDDATKFIQPFSQIPTASPMIRVRFGDMLKSNYSKFGLMRLFGLGEPEHSFNIDKGSVDPAKLHEFSLSQKEATDRAKVAAAMREIDPGASNAMQKLGLTKALGDKAKDIPVTGGDSQFGYQVGDLVNIQSWMKYWGRDESGKMAKQMNDAPAKKDAAWKIKKYKSDVEVEIVKRVPDGAHASGQTPDGFASHASSSPTSKAAEKAKADEPGTYYRRMAYMVKVNPGTPADIALGDNWDDKMKYHRALHGEIAGLSENGIRKLKESELEGLEKPARDDTDALKKWFNGNSDTGEHNYLVRSFESSMGRGLAGFITEIGFDWADSTWETTAGMRAPQMLKVSISFSPIHDIPLGLDADGMMRSVPYNVGKASRLIGGDPHGRTLENLQLEIAGAEKKASAGDTTPEGEGDLEDAAKSGGS